MSQQQPDEQPQPPRGHVRIVYLGPVAPHWEVESEFGDRAMIEAFRERALARLLLLPPHDPQFRRNRERVVRDAERENLELEWDLGIPEEETPPAAEAATTVRRLAELAGTGTPSTAISAMPSSPPIRVGTD